MEDVAIEIGQLSPLERVFNGMPEAMRPSTRFLRPIEFRLIATVDELTAATRLVYREYLRRGYIHAHPRGLKLSIFHALPHTVTFVAIQRETSRILGTMTLIEDSPLGLPMDEVYKPELDRMRNHGHRLAEASMLAFDSTLFGPQGFPRFHAKKMTLTLRLFKSMFDYLRSCTTVTELVACFNPRHRSLYDFLHLQPLGGMKAYSVVNNHPAVARHLNVAHTEQLARVYPVLQKFYGRRPSVKRFRNRLVFSPEQLQHVFTQLSSVFASASPTELCYVRACYPAYQDIPLSSPPWPVTTPALAAGEA